MKAPVTVNPWSKKEDDSPSIMLYNSEGAPDTGPLPTSGHPFVGPPTQQQLEEEEWKRQVLKQLLMSSG